MPCTKTITFIEAKLKPEGNGHVKLLHVAISCGAMITSGVLIDKGSTINVCPSMTLGRIGVEESMIHEWDDGTCIRWY